MRSFTGFVETRRERDLETLNIPLTNLWSTALGMRIGFEGTCGGSDLGTFNKQILSTILGSPEYEACA